MTTDLNWSRVQNGWHVSASRTYHAVRYTVGGVHGAVTRWRLTLASRNNPRSIADEPTLAAVKAAALAHKRAQEEMPIDGWQKREQPAVPAAAGGEALPAPEPERSAHVACRSCGREWYVGISKAVGIQYCERCARQMAAAAEEAL